tara:strand:- start:2302 stop:2937 length:636 start_codon:yes stop_codon:yes gene_type:complete
MPENISIIHLNKSNKQSSNIKNTSEHIYEDTNVKIYTTTNNKTLDSESEPEPEPCIKINACTSCDGPHPPRLWSRFQYSCPSFQYPNTEENLNERRKWEILQYKNNSSHLTQKQKFANFSKGLVLRRGQTFAVQSQSYTNPNLLGLNQVNNTLYCKSNSHKCSFTTSSDVPGPIRKICFRPDVMLYNYNNSYTYKASGTSWPQTRGKIKNF